MISVTSEVPGDSTEDLFDSDDDGAFAAFDFLVSKMESDMDNVVDAPEEDDGQDAVDQFQTAIDEVLGLPFASATIPYERTVELSSGERYTYKIDNV